MVGSQSEGNNPENGDATATDTVPGPAHLVYHLICQFFSKKLPILGFSHFLSDPGKPIYGSECHSVTPRPCVDLTDVTLNTNSKLNEGQSKAM